MGENRILEKFDSIVKDFSLNDRIALCHDLDADGLSSGAIAYNAIKLLRGREPDLVITQRYKTVELLPESVELLKKHKIQMLVVVDFALDQQPQSVLAAEGVVDEVLVIDHHKDYGLESQKTFVIKPQFFSKIEPSRYPCAKLCFDLFSRHVDLAEFSWIACVGLIGDMQLTTWKKFVQMQAKVHKTSPKEIGKVVRIIGAVETLEPRLLHDFLFLLANSGSPKEILRSRFAKYRARLERKVKTLLRGFSKHKEIYPKEDLVWFYFKSKDNIKSALVNEISHAKYPSKTVILVQDRGDGFVSFSARNQSFKVRTNDLLESAVKGFESAGAGGHVPASAGRIMKKDLSEFKRRVLEFLRNGSFRQK